MNRTTTMKYQVKKVAEISGVSVRTLHLYDELGLLKPAGRGANGYRYYEKSQLLVLQQILLYRELGFELKQIKRIVCKPSFDRISALISHRRILQQNLARTKKLIVTVDKTIDYLKGTNSMSNQELFAGFSPEVQAKHEQEIVERFGERAKEHIAQSKARVKNWTKADWEKSAKAFAGICQDLVKWMNQGATADSAEVQKVIRHHYEWLNQFWTPNRESYAGHGQFIADSKLRHAFEEHHPKLPEFVREAIGVYAERNLK
jgi:DNA-binding transcriptional MerR regulator